MDRMLVGISWKPPGGDPGALVLDLSVLLYNDAWEFLGDCSWVGRLCVCACM
jgi:hypothetical protein